MKDTESTSPEQPPRGRVSAGTASPPAALQDALTNASDPLAQGGPGQMLSLCPAALADPFAHNALKCRYWVLRKQHEAQHGASHIVKRLRREGPAPALCLLSEATTLRFFSLGKG